MIVHPDNERKNKKEVDLYSLLVKDLQDILTS